MTRKKLKNRLIYLFSFELFSAFLFSAVFWYYFDYLNAGAMSVVGLSFVILILLQGSLLWFSRYREITGKPIISERQLQTFFNFFKTVNFVLIFILPLCFALFLFDGSTILSADFVLGTAFYLFAVLEYINYYHWQLMYDNLADIQWLLQNKKLKRAFFRRDLIND